MSVGNAAKIMETVIKLQMLEHLRTANVTNECKIIYICLGYSGRTYDPSFDLIRFHHTSTLIEGLFPRICVIIVFMINRDRMTKKNNCMFLDLAIRFLIRP